MNTDLTIHNALLAGMPGSGKAMASALLSQLCGDERTDRVERGDDNTARHPVTATQGRAACGQQQEVTG